MMIESFLYASVYVQVGLIVFALSFLGYLSMALTKSKAISTVSYGLFVLGFLILTVFLVTRWIEAGRPPFKTVYESLIFGGWMISLISIFLESRYKLRIMSLLTTLSVVGILLYALSKRDLEIVPMPPALQTWIFIPHVISYFLAYGALFVSGVSALLYLLFPKGIKGHHLVGDNQRIDFSEFTYIIAKFGFLFLTLGLFLGGWWGQVAWSSYWGWDPKENWALISWLIFAAYLHLNKMHHFSKRTLAMTVIIGVVAIIFTYLGMDYLPTAEQSIHIYLQ